MSLCKTVFNPQFLPPHRNSFRLNYGETEHRLPSETECEYACRAGSTTAYHFGDNKNLLTRYANYADLSLGFDWSDQKNSDGHSNMAPVGSYQPNSWGFYDMHGNVDEWVWDWFTFNYPKALEKVSLPEDILRSHSEMKVYRGGNLFSYARSSRTASRFFEDGNLREHTRGFRLALKPKK